MDQNCKILDVNVCLLVKLQVEAATSENSIPKYSMCGLLTYIWVV